MQLSLIHICIADIKAGEAIPETFEECKVRPEFAGVINTLQDDISISHATINQTRYWSLSNTKGMTGENHLYQSPVGRFDQPTILASWDNHEKQVLSLVTTSDRILLICEDRIDEYDVQGDVYKRQLKSSKPSYSSEPFKPIMTSQRIFQDVSSRCS